MHALRFMFHILFLTICYIFDCNVCLGSNMKRRVELFSNSGDREPGTDLTATVGGRMRSGTPEWPGTYYLYTGI